MSKEVIVVLAVVLSGLLMSLAIAVVVAVPYIYSLLATGWLAQLLGALAIISMTLMPWFLAHKLIRPKKDIAKTP